MPKPFNIGAAINGVMSAQRLLETKFNPKPRDNELKLCKERLAEALGILQWARDNRADLVSGAKK